MSLNKAYQRGISYIKSVGGSTSTSGTAQDDRKGMTTASQGQLFPKVDPAIDGEDCEHDCASCENHFPRSFKIDEDDKLYGHVNGWATHMLVATGKTDWVRDVQDEKGSVMEAVRDCGIMPNNGKLMLSASNMPLPAAANPVENDSKGTAATTVLLLPSFRYIDNVTPAKVPELIQHHISPSNTNIDPLESTQPSPPLLQPTPSLISRQCPHRYLILLCSQRTRDARCGQSAPLLRREFERHLRPLGLYRDMNDTRPGGVGIYFISHVGGHKYSANVIIYRRNPIAETSGTEKEVRQLGEASQCIWLARVRPEDCEGIVRYTLLQGKVVKPDRQLRGGFDRERGLVSW